MPPPIIHQINIETELFNDALSGLKHFLATESPLKMIENAFYLILKVHSQF